jgi:hypothetical protein
MAEFDREAFHSSPDYYSLELAELQRIFRETMTSKDLPVLYEAIQVCVAKNPTNEEAHALLRACAVRIVAINAFKTLVDERRSSINPHNAMFIANAEGEIIEDKPGFTPETQLHEDFEAIMKRSFGSSQ